MDDRHHSVNAIGSWVVGRHAHVVVDGGTESCESSASNGGSLWSSFGGQNTSCQAASSDSVR